MKEDLWAVWSSTLWGNTCMIHRETFQDTVATAKKSIFATLFQTRKKHRCTSPHGLNRLTPHGEQYIFGSRSCFVLQLITTWMVEKCKLFVFYHVFEKHFMLQESNKELSKTGWVLQFGAPSWISNIIGKLGGCLKEFVIFSQFVVEWRNTTLAPWWLRQFLWDPQVLFWWRDSCPDWFISSLVHFGLERTWLEWKSNRDLKVLKTPRTVGGCFKDRESNPNFC